MHPAPIPGDLCRSAEVPPPKPADVEFYPDTARRKVPDIANRMRQVLVRYLFIPGSLSFGLIQTAVALEQCVTVLRNKQECTHVSNAIRYSVSIRVISAFQELIVFSDVYQGDFAVGTLHLTSVMLAVRQSLMIVRPYRYMEEA